MDFEVIVMQLIERRVCKIVNLVHFHIQPIHHVMAQKLEPFIFHQLPDIPLASSEQIIRTEGGAALHPAGAYRGRHR